MQIIEAGAVLPVHMAEALTGESPFWDAECETLWWIDIQGQRLLGFEPATGRKISHRMPLMPGFVARFAQHGLVVGLEDGVYAIDPVHGAGDRLFPVEADVPGNRLNDGKVDASGRLWFGSMDKTGNGEPVGALYALTPDGVLTQHRTAVRIPNAIAFSPSCDIFYFSDSRTGIVEAFDYDIADGTLSNGRIFAAYSAPEHPDGACVDAEGNVWIAVVNGARAERRRPDGTVDRIVKLPVSRPTMPMLGGPDRRTLFVTSQRRFLTAAQLRSEPCAGNLIAVSLGSTPPGGG